MNVNLLDRKTVQEDENGIRLDTWFKIHYPTLKFGHLQKLLRSGQIRVDGKRVKTNFRIETGQLIRVPPLEQDKTVTNTPKIWTFNTIKHQKDREILEKILLYEDSKIFIFNKPSGLAVQGGSSVTRHIDGMLDSWRNKKNEKPRLVHRIDRETSGILIVARTRSAARKLTAGFRERETKKRYWSLVRGVPKKHQDKISTWLVKRSTSGEDKMFVCSHGEEGSVHSLSHYRLIETAARRVSWLEMEPYTGRTHQLRVHSAYIDHPIIGDSKYFHCDSNWNGVGGIQNKLHLHARFISFQHPDGGTIEMKAPLPPHMVQSFNLLGFNTENA